jgi:DNA-binding CsgD family transcriptional regulator
MILSEREKEALRLLLVGHDAKSIANLLGLSVHTVNDRLRDARRKMGATPCRNRAGGARYLRGQGNRGC